MTKAIRYTVPATLKPRRVAMLIYPGVTPLDVVGPLEVFSFANVLRKQHDLRCHHGGPDDGAVMTKAGIAFLPTCAMTELALPVDTLMVAGGGTAHLDHPGDDRLASHRGDAGPPLRFDLHRRVPARRRRTDRRPSGDDALGVLRGPRAAASDRPGRSRSDLRPRRRFFSSAGISAGIDLALSLVEEDHGRDLALTVARYLVLYLKRSGGQAQFSARLQAQFSDVPAIERVQLWCRENLAGDLRAGALCQIAGMSERDFMRKFRRETGQTVGDYVAAVRLEAACGLLTETAQPLKEIARKCGFASVAALRRTFLSRIGVAPRQYREHFQLSERGDRFTPRQRRRRRPVDAPPHPPAEPHGASTRAAEIRAPDRSRSAIGQIGGRWRRRF